MARSLLNDRALIPLFHLPKRDGEVFDSSDLKRRKNFVLFFLTDPCPEFLIKAEEAYVRIKEQNAELAIVVSVPLASVENFYRRNRLTFSILSDPAQQVFSKFLSFEKDEPVAALFITDRYGEIFFQYTQDKAVSLPPFEDIAKSLVFIESQCPECGGAF